MSNYAGMVAALTGGASGIGDAIVRRLLRGGARVAVLDVNASLLAERQREFGGTKFRGVVGDVTDEAVVSGFVSDCVTHFGNLNAAFNVAGSGRGTTIISNAVEDWDFTVDLCLKGVFLSVKHEARQMLSAGGGSIVNISSVCAHLPVYGAAGYCAAKAGVEMLTKVAALELAGKGVRVNTVLPGYTDTPGVRSGDDLPAFHRTVIERVPIGRAASADEIAGAALFLASDDARYIVGTSLVVDGGWELAGSPDFRPFVDGARNKPEERPGDHQGKV
jgi:NAD(P)-dependent dehydrogenase (short-subunit alcohol dehydrogenase family)